MPGPIPGDKPATAAFKAARKAWRWNRPEQKVMLEKTATLVAELCLAYNIPIRFLKSAGLLRWNASGRKAAMGGITTHAYMSQTFHESTHWDPGFWPRRRFIRLVKREAAKIKAAQ